MRKSLFTLLLMGISYAVNATPVDLNSATQAQLESVNGIGPGKARSIVEYRTKNGAFKSVDDLAKVNGFSTKTIDKLRPELTVNTLSTVKK